MTNTPVECPIINGGTAITPSDFQWRYYPSFTPEEIRVIRIALRHQMQRENYHSHDDHEHERSASSRIETLKTVLEKLK